MRSSTIHKLAWYIPIDSLVDGDDCWNGVTGLSFNQARQTIHFAKCYKNMQFGWDVARVLADSKIPFPAILHGDDLYVWRAYNYLRGATDATILNAVALTMDGNKNTRSQIEALLVADHVDCSFIARRLKMPEPVIKAYEKLFFNVLDRKQDHAFIANLIYPDGRMVEGLEGYLNNTDLGTLMLRAGYTKGIEHVLYAAALSKDNPYAHRDAATGAADLDAMFMAEGCLYANMGWLNQRSNSMPISNARLSMQASKMGKGNEAGNGDSVITIGDDFRTELVHISAMKAAAHSRAMALEVVPEIPKNEFNEGENIQSL